MLNHLEYDAFGKRISATSSAAGNTPLFAYTGKMFDGSIDLQWNINRWYDTGVGRWISEDPIGFEARDVNLYRYVENMVMSQMDFDGKKVYAIDGTHSYKFSPTNVRRIDLFGNFKMGP